MSASPAARLVRMFALVAGQPAHLTGDRPVPTEPSRPTLVGRQPTPISDDAAALDRAAQYLKRARPGYSRGLSPLTWNDAATALRQRAETLRLLAAKAGA